MKQHQYQIRVEHLADQEGNPRNETMTFSAPNHDDLFLIVEKIKQREGFSEEMAQRFGVGLKLFSEVLLENRKNPFCAELLPHFYTMMDVVKGKKSRESE